MGFIYERVQNGFFFDEDVITSSTIFCHLHIVTHFAFKAHIGHEAHTCFSVHTGQVASIGVAIGVTILYIEDVNEINSVHNTIALKSCYSVTYSSFFV